MPNLLIIAKSPAVRAGLIIPGAVMMILLGITELSFLSGTAAALIKTLALAGGILAGFCHILGIMPSSLANEEIEWRKRYSEEYGNEDWETVPFFHSLLVRIREVEKSY
ncbi:hypothetical protein [Agrobacterium tumefaciens]|uniref:hypothetical protein n=1 Tax=Agrobacterium tumefaciens TaxID=358 RepID=UPI000DD4F172|nr:hypothetical protein [Agrobacterium tumefaciens]AYM08914.1 hypothetical protein At1D1460_46730 [Agrobacterium tumefaciens]NSZ35716.1 hypothetical protein [Agrobacterium tumefaciens]QLG25366.1 hypothetical protein EML4_23555 [Agrobacterium tumefaciens]UXS89240.1 hypothetical protein FY144_23490 [Agrobacterium tumefaciens]